MIYVRNVDSIKYCTDCNQFFGDKNSIRYPLVLNWLITDRCNLDCRYCFATDIINTNIISSDVVEYVNNSSFLKIVVSGGEPFCNNAIWDLLPVLRSDNRAIVIDTNGTYLFKHDEITLIKSKNITLRISLDSTIPKDNNRLRSGGNNQLFKTVIDNIEKLRFDYDVNVEIQTVVTKLNIKNLPQISKMISYWRINKWYLQPLIPSGRGLGMERYSPTTKSIYRESKLFPLNPSKFVIKEDENNRAVLLLTNYGHLISENTIGNIELGTIYSIKNENLIDLLNIENHLMRYKIQENCNC